MTTNPAPCDFAIWSPIVSAGPESTFAGILAGFVFLGMISIWTVEHPTSRQAGEWPKRRSYALQFFSVAFIVLALDSYITAITSGEADCNRASVEEAFSGGSLGIGAAAMLAGLAWQLVTLSERVRELKVILRWMLGGLGLLIVFMLALSAVGVGEQLLNGRSHDFVDSVPWIAGAVLLIAVVFAVRRGLRSDPEKLGRAVLAGSLAALADGILSTLFGGIGGIVSIGYWATAPTPMVDIIVVLMIVMPGIALVATAAPAMAAVRTDAAEKPSAMPVLDSTATSAVAADDSTMPANDASPGARPVHTLSGTRGLTRANLRQRHDTYLADHYLSIHMMVVTLALGVAGLAAVDLITPSAKYDGDQGVLWVLWVASVLATAVAYAGTMIGAIVLPPRLPAVVDLLLPLLLGVTELTLFAILIVPDGKGPSLRDILTAWWFAFGLFGLTAAGAIWRAVHVITGTPRESELDKAVTGYLESIRMDKFAATAVGALGVTVGIAHAVDGKLDAGINYAAGGLVVAMLGFGLYSHYRTADKLRNALAASLNDA